MDTKYQCYKCSKNFSSHQRLQYHLQSKPNCDSNEFQWKCEFCHKSFSRKFCLNRHILDKHNGYVSNQIVEPSSPNKIKFNINLNNDPKNTENVSNETTISLSNDLCGEITSRKLVELIGKISEQISEQNQRIDEQNQKIVKLT